LLLNCNNISQYYGFTINVTLVLYFMYGHPELSQMSKQQDKIFPFKQKLSNHI